MSEIGHNSDTTLDDSTQKQLRAFVERIERLEEEKQCIASDIKDVKAEAKANGYDVKILNKVLSIRKMDAHQRAEELAVFDLYLHALGMA